MAKLKTAFKVGKVQQVTTIEASKVTEVTKVKLYTEDQAVTVNLTAPKNSEWSHFVRGDTVDLEVSKSQTRIQDHKPKKKKEED